MSIEITHTKPNGNTEQVRKASRVDMGSFTVKAFSGPFSIDRISVRLKGLLGVEEHAIPVPVGFSVTLENEKTGERFTVRNRKD